MPVMILRSAHVKSGKFCDHKANKLSDEPLGLKPTEDQAYLDDQKKGVGVWYNSARGVLFFVICEAHLPPLAFVIVPISRRNSLLSPFNT